MEDGVPRPSLCCDYIFALDSEEYLFFLLTGGDRVRSQTDYIQVQSTLNVTICACIATPLMLSNELINAT